MKTNWNKPKKIKKKKNSRKSIIKRADEACKLYIKEKYHWKCITCGKTKLNAVMSWGHYKTSAVYYTRWNEYNLACQCISCNNLHEYNTYNYDKWFMNTYGIETWDLLNLTFNKNRPIKGWEIDMIADYYTEKLKNPCHEIPYEIRELVTLDK